MTLSLVFRIQAANVFAFFGVTYASLCQPP